MTQEKGEGTMTADATPPTKPTNASTTGTKDGVRQLMRRTKRVTRRRFSADEKIRVVLEGVRAEHG